MQAPKILRVSEFQIEKLNSLIKFPPAADAGGFPVVIDPGRWVVDGYSSTPRSRSRTPGAVLVLCVKKAYGSVFRLQGLFPEEFS